jgi:DNA-binding CsgD family transcriptional regulator
MGCSLVRHRASSRNLRVMEDAREALTAARAVFDSMGASAWADRATAEAERISGRRPRESGLTPTEQHVAELAAAGRTNREVAANLYLSLKAVEANLSRVYRKLAIRGRGELAARLRPRDHVRGWRRQRFAASLCRAGRREAGAPAAPPSAIGPANRKLGETSGTVTYG